MTSSAVQVVFCRSGNPPSQPRVTVERTWNFSDTTHHVFWDEAKIEAWNVIACARRPLQVVSSYKMRHYGILCRLPLTNPRNMKQALPKSSSTTEHAKQICSVLKYYTEIIVLRRPGYLDANQNKGRCRHVQNIALCTATANESKAPITTKEQ